VSKMNLIEIPSKVWYTLKEYKRIFLISRKPSLEDLIKISKVSAIGMIVIGLIGFIVQLIFSFMKGV